MSVLIKGMEMPDRCFACPLCDVIDSEVNCVISHGSYKEYREIAEQTAINGRPSDCPLVPVPPHGRLIDADAFTKDECNYCDGACEALPCDCLNCKSDCRCDFMKDIADAPTIIPAEEDECKVCANADNEYCFACDNGNQFKPITQKEEDE